jgi:5-methylcytosine-specific restriction endonuclease McrA
MGKILFMAERQVVHTRTTTLNRGALARYAIGKIPAEDLYLKIGLQEYKCMYCKWTISFHTCEIDHIYPVSKGGEHYLYNIALTCSTCNQSKKARTLRRFCKKMGFDWEFIMQEIAEINHKLHIAVFGADLDESEDAA